MTVFGNGNVTFTNRDASLNYVFADLEDKGSFAQVNIGWAVGKRGQCAFKVFYCHNVTYICN